MDGDDLAEDRQSIGEIDPNDSLVDISDRNPRQLQPLAKLLGSA